MTVNWARTFNRLFELINSEGSAYFSGVRFISAVREVDPYYPDYSQFMQKRRTSGRSTSRKDYFYDILLGFHEDQRCRIILGILDQIQSVFPDRVGEIKDEMAGVATGPTAQVPDASWNSDRLARYLQEIDARISSGNYEGAVTLGYTCLEGFLKAFIKRNMPNHAGSFEIIDASKTVRAYLRNAIDKYPDEALTMIGHIAHTVDRARNGFSESHFDEVAGKWLAVFVRDLVNSEIRLLLHFFISDDAAS